MKTCRNCGALNGDLMTKCNSCGAALEESIKLELETETYVQPPVFPDEEEENQIELTLASEPETKTAADTAASQEPAESTISQDVPGTPPVYPDPPAFDSEPDDAEAKEVEPEVKTPYYTGPASYTNPRTETSAGGRVNLTQEAINEHKQRRQEEKAARGGGFSNSQSSFRSKEYQPDPAKAASITGTTGLVVGLIGMILVIVFGAIGSCSGVGAASLVLTLVGLALSIVGLVISGRDRRESGGTCSRANAAFVVSLIGIIIGAILLLIGVCCVGCIGCIGCAAANAIIG